MAISLDDVIAVLELKHGFSFSEQVLAEVHDRREKKEEFEKAMEKTSGVDGDVGGWTEHGDGTDYPSNVPKAPLGD